MNVGKTAVFQAPYSIVLEDYSVPDLRPDEILIKVEACAICTWEQRVYTGEKEVVFPFIGGHEIAAEVVALGTNIPRDFWKIGDKVVYGLGAVCGECEACKRGELQNCHNYNHSKQIGGLPHKGMGGFSEYIVAKSENLFHYANVSPTEAALVEPLSCVLHSVETAKLEFGQTVVVIGCGMMGLLHTQLALKSGAYVICSDPVSSRLSLAKELGAHEVINPREENLREKVLELTNQVGADVVFNTTPIYQVAQDAIGLLAQLGTLVLYSSFYPDHPISLSPDRLHKEGYQIVGSANSNARDFLKATKLISQGIIDMKPFVNGVYPLSQIEAALETATTKDNFRVVVTMTDERKEDN